jgi:hypothetical protein
LEPPARSLTTICLTACLVLVSVMTFHIPIVKAEDDYTVYLFPNGDSSVNWDLVYPASPTTHYDKVDEPTHDSSTTYIRTSTASDIDIFTMSDMSEPEAGYSINVTVFGVHQKDATQPCDFQAGIRISSTNYITIQLNPTNGAWTNSSGAVWNLNPATSAEWTYSEVNALLGVITTNDASPNVYCTQLGLKIDVTFEEEPATWAPTFTSSPDTTATEDEAYSYEATCNETVTWPGDDTIATNATWLTWTQANHTVWGTPGEGDIGSFYVNITATSTAGTLEGYQNYTVTVEAAPHAEWAPTFTSEPDTTATEAEAYSYTATCNETVTWGAAMTSNATWLTWTQANHTVWGTPDSEDVGSYYVNITATSDEGTLEGYQNYTVTVEAAPTAEWAPTFTSEPDLSVTAGEHYSYEATCNETVTWSENINTDADWLTWTQANHTVWGTPDGEDVGTYYVNITATSDAGTLEGYQNYSLEVEPEPMTWAPTFTSEPDLSVEELSHYTYTATCNESVSWPEAITTNATWLTWTQANHTVWGTPANEDIGSYYVNITATSVAGTLEGYQNYTLEVTAIPPNEPPVITSTPSDSSHNNTLYYYNAEATDTEEDELTWDLEGSITDFASINPTTGVVQGTPTAIGDYWLNVSVTDGVSTIWQNTSIHIYTDSPSFVTSAITTWQNGTTYLYNAQASDPEAEGLTFHLEGNGTSFVGITPAGYYCELEGAITQMGWWYLNLSVTDGTNTVWQNWSLTALNTAPTFTNTPITEGLVNVSYSWAPNATDINGDTLIYSIDASPDETKNWLVYNVSSGYLEGIPTENGSYMVNLSVTDTVGATTWLNFTLTVDLDDTETISVLALIIALIFCIALLALGLRDKTFWLAAGPVWIFCGIAIFMDYGDAFMLMSVGLGLVLLIRGAYDVWA